MKISESLLFAATSLLAGVAFGAEATVTKVVSIAPPRENPVTALVAPSSNLSPDIARFVATQLMPIVPGTEVFTVMPTGSMRPAFDDNTVLLTEPAPFDELQIGDIVVFLHRGSGARVVHRIIERRDGGYWTKGDRSARMDDELVTPGNYIGRVYGIFYTSRAGEKPLPEPLRQNEEHVAAARVRPVR